jgi:hypothetical protein
MPGYQRTGNKTSEVNTRAPMIFMKEVPLSRDDLAIVKLVGLCLVPEAYEMVEDGLASAADFRDFTFANVVRLFGRQNPRFFFGSRVAAAAEAVLREAVAPARAAAE